jgi:hypothetical protein
MKNYAQAFLNELAGLPPDTFESRFSTSSTALGLGAVLDRNELTLLYETAFCASLCYHAINGLGQYEGKINAEGEPNRIKLESEFLVARDAFFASAGWQTLSTSEQAAIQARFLSVSVADDKLAQ